MILQTALEDLHMIMSAGTKEVKIQAVALQACWKSTISSLKNLKRQVQIYFILNFFGWDSLGFLNMNVNTIQVGGITKLL